MIIFEGIIGSGKSTLSERFVKKVERCKLFHEPVATNPYLELFYKEPLKYGLEMQFWLMAERYRMHLDGAALEWKTGITSVYDRSIYGDLAFAYVLNQTCLISYDGYRTYLNMRKMMERSLLAPHIVFYLDLSAKTAKQRITTRGRECEAKIPVDYLEKLDKAYRKVVLPPLKETSTVIMLDGRNSVAKNLAIAIDSVKNGKMNHQGL